MHRRGRQWARDLQARVKEAGKDLGDRSYVGIRLFQEIASEPPGTACNQENENDKGCRRTHNHRQQCGAAVCITKDITKRIMNIEKFAKKR